MDWISVKDRLPDVMAGKYKVKRSNGTEMPAYYYMDAMSWIAFYGMKTTHWWESSGSHEPLYNVTHWMEK